MSIDTVALAASTAEADFHPTARLEQELDAEFALAKLERDVQRIARHLDPFSTVRSGIPRRSRRSAWVPTL